MALRRLLIRATKPSAYKISFGKSGAVFEGSFSARASSGLDATTSGAGLVDEGRNADFIEGQGLPSRRQGPEGFEFGAPPLDGSGPSISSGDGKQKQESGSREVQAGHNDLKHQPLSQIGSIEPALRSCQNQELPLFGLRNLGYPLQFKCNPLSQVRHYANAAVVEDTDVDPSVSMHREQFLRASSRKVEKPQPVIKAYLRDAPGKIPNKKERRQGLVPGVIFSGKDGHKGGDKRLISVGHKQLSAILQPLGKFFFSAMTWDLELYEGRPGEEAAAKKTVERVVPKSVHLHAATDEPMNVTFMRVSPDEKITVDVPLLFIGEDACPGLKKGGRLNTVRRLVRYVCPGDKVPPYLEVDISRLNIGQSIYLKDLPADPALRIVAKDLKMPVLKISGRTQTDSADGE